MDLDTEILSPVVKGADPDEDRVVDGAPWVAPLPASIVLSERGAAVLRAYLSENGLGTYTVFVADDLEVDDIDHHLQAMGESAQWEPMAAAAGQGLTVCALTHGLSKARWWQAGVLQLTKFQVVIARWYWMNETGQLHTLRLGASASPEAFIAMRDALRAQRRKSGGANWQIFRDAWNDPERMERETEVESLVMTPELRRRLHADMVSFFSNEVAALYRGLKVPYRRGVLLYGPPGNGKTSLIRWMAAQLKELPMIVLRPAARFNLDGLGTILRKWSAQAPAVLIIEDLDWLLKQVNVSGFLNALDGIDNAMSEAKGGLLLVATTNHPENLDGAINNRPGRFDVVLEMPLPGRALREEFFRGKLVGVDGAVLSRIVDETDGLSFAHLQEILRASGLAAIHAGRAERSEDDLLAAVEAARAVDEQAGRRFMPKPEMPFGLSARRERVR